MEHIRMNKKYNGEKNLKGLNVVNVDVNMRRYMMRYRSMNDRTIPKEYIIIFSQYIPTE